MKFIHTADWQLGMTRHYFDEDGAARFSEARETAIRRIGEVAREQDAQFVVVAGDVFEHSMSRPRTVRRALEAMKTISVPVFLLPGNHDPIGVESVYRSSIFVAEKPDNVHVIENETPFLVDSHVELVGIPWTSKQMIEDRVAACLRALPPADGRLRVMVAHGQTAGMGDLNNLGRIDLDAVEDAIRAGRLHYLALGDRHSTTRCDDAGRVWYSGAPEPTDYDEDDPGNVLLVDVDRRAVTVTRIPVGTWRFLEETLQLRQREAVSQVRALLAGVADKQRTVVKLHFAGTIGLDDQLALDEFLNEQRQVFGAIERHLHRDRLAIMPPTGGFEDLKVSGYAREALDELLSEATQEGANDGPFHDALALYYRLARGV